MDVSLVPNDDGDLVFSNGGDGDLLRAHTHITRLMLAAVFYFSAETIVLALLTLTTGTNPVLNIEQYRPLVAWARMFMWLALLWMVRDGAVLVFREFDSTESRR